jgi:hypothetical protein
VAGSTDCSPSAGLYGLVGTDSTLEYQLIALKGGQLRRKHGIILIKFVTEPMLGSTVLVVVVVRMVLSAVVPAWTGIAVSRNPGSAVVSYSRYSKDR